MSGGILVKGNETINSLNKESSNTPLVYSLQI